jgi:ATP-binding cassette subfamily B multidrug efflux pump
VRGVDVRDVDPQELRAQFGVVLQDPFLFTGDIASNIRLGSPHITDEDLRAAAAQVNLLDYVNALPGGFQHSVRERGAGLSTGQKQLISFARALAHNPRFLILDEATSSVDTETEMRVREGLGRLIEGRTSIVIAHRLSTIQRADQIVVLDQGRIVQTGTHAELVAAPGLYQKLHRLQFRLAEAGDAPHDRAG